MRPRYLIMSDEQFWIDPADCGLPTVEAEERKRRDKQQQRRQEEEQKRSEREESERKMKEEAERKRKEEAKKKEQALKAGEEKRREEVRKKAESQTINAPKIDITPPGSEILSPQVPDVNMFGLPDLSNAPPPLTPPPSPPPSRLAPPAPVIDEATRARQEARRKAEQAAAMDLDAVEVAADAATDKVTRAISKCIAIFQNVDMRVGEKRARIQGLLDSFGFKYDILPSGIRELMEEGYDEEAER